MGWIPALKLHKKYCHHAMVNNPYRTGAPKSGGANVDYEKWAVEIIAQMIFMEVWGLAPRKKFTFWKLWECILDTFYYVTEVATYSL